MTPSIHYTNPLQECVATKVDFLMINIELCKQSRQLVSKGNRTYWVGVQVSSAIAVAWISSLMWLFSWDLTDCSAIALALGVFVRTFLHTGLFAIAHDAMHNNVLPRHPRENRWIGSLALGMYGFLPYFPCHKLHWQHHCYPAQARDPDFHADSGNSPLWHAVKWYFLFVSTYLNSRQLILTGIGIGLISFAIVAGAKVSLLHLVLFWIVPWCLSSIQLFIFGTYLPHYSIGNPDNLHAARSYYFPKLFSMLACYHFGYHWEHHAYPHLPWYRLPEAVRHGSIEVTSTT